MRYIYSYLVFSLVFLVFCASSVEGEVRPQVTVDPSIEQTTISISAETMPTQIIQEKPVEYTLSYPGMLPDSPLYILKVIRDKIISLLISDPLKKAEFDLLQADKRLQAGVYLVDKDKSKTSLAISTISKGQNYFEEAISKAQEAKNQGKDANGMLERLITAGKKHQEVLQGFAIVVQEGARGDVAVIRKRMEDLEKTAMKIKQ